MGIPAESPVVMRLRNREGVALVAAIFGIVIIGLITAGAFALTDLDTKATHNRADAATALNLAHTAEVHALSLFRTHLNDTTINRLLRGFDNSPNTADDGLFDNYPGLGDSLDIEATGRAAAGGTYFVRILDDPNDGDANPLNDTNWRFVVRCAGETPRGSRAVIEFVVRYLPPLPGIAYDGNLTISGNTTVSGACGDIHVNGNVSIGSTMHVNRWLTATGSASGGSNVKNAADVTVGVTLAPVPVPIPTLSAATYCPAADYVMQADGYILRRSDNTLHNATGSAKFGWKRAGTGPVIWTSDSNLVTSGTYCVMGNLQIPNNLGTALVPLPLSVFATGSIEISGNPYLRPEDGSGIMMLADGDLKINGNPTTTVETNFQGMMYGGSNCEISGNPNLTGQFLCKSGPLPAGAKDLISENKISGNARITYSCTWAVPNDKYRITSWYQRIGM